MDGLSPTHLILVLVVALLVIGPAKLPETGEALGRALRQFRHAMDGRANAGRSARTSRADERTALGLSRPVSPPTRMSS